LTHTVVTRVGPKTGMKVCWITSHLGDKPTRRHESVNLATSIRLRPIPEFTDTDTLDLHRYRYQ